MRRSMGVASVLVLLLMLQASAQPTVVPPAQTLVSVNWKATPAAQAVQDLADAAQIEIEPLNAGDLTRAAPVTFDADQQPFWVVMNEFARQAGFGVFEDRDVPRKLKLQLEPTARAAPPHCINGAFVFTPALISRSYTTDYYHPDRSGNCTLVAFDCWVDPALRLLDARADPTIDEAIGENGQPMVLAKQFKSQRPRMQSASGYLVTQRALFDCSDPPHRMLKSFKATAKFRYVSKQEVWKLDALPDAVGQQKQFPLITFIIHSIEQWNQAAYVLKIRAKYDPAKRQQFADNPLIEGGGHPRSMRITDGGGRELAINGYSQKRLDRSEVEFEYRIVRASDADDATAFPAAFEWMLPTEISEISVPFEFKDLPIP